MALRQAVLQAVVGWDVRDTGTLSDTTNVAVLPWSAVSTVGSPTLPTTVVFETEVEPELVFDPVSETDVPTGLFDVAGYADPFGLTVAVIRPTWLAMKVTGTVEAGKGVVLTQYAISEALEYSAIWSSPEVFSNGILLLAFGAVSPWTPIEPGVNDTFRVEYTSDPAGSPDVTVQVAIGGLTS
jgi:hypothetical protein